MDAVGATGSRRRHLLPKCLLIAVLVMASAACGLQTAGHPGRATPDEAPASTSAPGPMPPPARCRVWGCRPRQTIELTRSWTVRLWLSTDELNSHSRPVVQLLHGPVAVQWWISPQGDGWEGSLTCLTSGREPNCDLIDSRGMHAQIAEMLILRGGRLVHPARAEAISNSFGMRAVDLNGDRYLDVIGTTNDYRPNFAQGHNYWQTFRYQNGQLRLTGCAPKSGNAPAPSSLLTGTCPLN